LRHFVYSGFVHPIMPTQPPPPTALRRRLCSLVLLTAAAAWPRLLCAAPVQVRFVEGVVHGFLVLRTVDGTTVASGDLLQTARNAGVEARMLFRFTDGSVFDETV